MVMAIIVVVTGAVLICLAALLGLRAWAREGDRIAEEIHRPGHQLLVYDVPEGQDPAVLLAALAHAGFTSVPDTVRGISQIAVDCPEGRKRDRELVREVIARAASPGFDGTTLTLEQVRFEDES